MNIRISKQRITIRFDFNDEQQLVTHSKIEQKFKFSPFLNIQISLHISEESNVMEDQGYLEIHITKSELDSILNENLRNGIQVGKFTLEKDFKSTQSKRDK